MQLRQMNFKNINDVVGKEIHCELCKKLLFLHTNKRNMHKLEYVLEKWIQFSEALPFKQIIKSQPEDQANVNKRKENNLPSS